MAMDEMLGVPDFGPAGERAGLGEAEVHQLRAALGQHDVSGLQIAVNDAGAMSLVEGVRHIDRDLD